MAKVSPAYTIPVIDQMEIWECAVALGVHRVAEYRDGLPPAREGYAYPDPADPGSVLAMRERHERVVERLAHERYGTPTGSFVPALSWQGLDADVVAALSAEASREAPLPEGHETNPAFLMVAAANGWDIHDAAGAET